MRALPLAVVISALLCPFAGPSPAHAGGFDYPAPGTRALGRGGAFYARADDPMALLYDPANLASLSPNQLMLNVHLGFFDACYRPTGNYEPNVFAPTVFDADPADSASYGLWAGAKPEICNSGPPGPSPDLAFTTRLGPTLGLGFGIVAPSAVGHQIYADEVEPGTIDNGRLPAPARYSLLEQDLIIAYPTVGVGWRALRWLQIGASFQWGIGIFSFKNQTRALPGRSPDGDIRSELTATDFFIPAGIVSVHATPIDSLDIVLSARLHANVDAGGQTKLTWGSYVPETTVSGAPIRTTTTIDDTRLRAPQPWQFALGVRYADRITPRPSNVMAVERLSDRVEDSMSSERWDVEVDAVYETNSRVDEFVVDLPDDAVLQERNVGAPDETLPLPDEIHIPHQWKDQLSLRVGGDYNVIPGMAAVRLGASFETNGVDPSYTGIDFIPGQRIGLHGGLTLRFGRLEVSLAYAHIFQADITVDECPATSGSETEPQRTTRCDAADQAALRQISANDPEKADIINAGTYTANFDILSLGVTWHIP